MPLLVLPAEQVSVREATLLSPSPPPNEQEKTRVKRDDSLHGVYQRPEFSLYWLFVFMRDAFH